MPIEFGWITKIESVLLKVYGPWVKVKDSKDALVCVVPAKVTVPSMAKPLPAVLFTACEPLDALPV
jgi:hypothetical protein